MGQQESPRYSSDKRIWNQIYRTLKEFLKSQRSQIETLIHEREFLENYAHFQHEQWRSRSQYLECHIAQMKEEQDKIRLVEDAKMRVFVGFNESEALFYKMQLELAESELEDFRSCLEATSAEMEELKEKLKTTGASETAACTSNVTGSSENFKGRDQSIMSMKKEIKKLKHAYRELSSRKEAEVSSLLAEKDFVWNQFKKMEDDYSSILKGKRAETDQVKKANEKLQNNIEMLHALVNTKDEFITKLEDERAILKLDVRKLAEKAEQVFSKMKKIKNDMDEQKLAVKEKEVLIAKLREELRNLKGDLKKNILDNSRGKNNSKGKYQIGSNAVYGLQRCSRKRKLESCDINTSHKRGISCEVTFQTPTTNNRLDQDSIEKKGRTLSPARMQSPLFHSDFKVPKLKRSAPPMP